MDKQFLATALKQHSDSFSFLPAYMDTKSAHPEAKEETYGPCVFIVKSLLLGTPFDDGNFPLDCSFDQSLEQAIMRFQKELCLNPDACFGQETQELLFPILFSSMKHIPYTTLATCDHVHNSKGELSQWPPSDISFNYSREPPKLFPPRMDYPSLTDSFYGPSILILKCLFAGTEYTQKKYPLDLRFCSGLRDCIANFQASQHIQVDGCFGPETRKFFAQKFGRDLEQIPRNILHEPNRVLQPDGQIIAWPPVA